MKIFFLIGFFSFINMQAKAQQNIYPTYTGNDLGLTYSKAASSFRIWAPTATRVQLNLYKQSLGGDKSTNIQLKRSVQGTWTTTLSGDRAGTFYTFSVEHNGQWLSEVPDPYAKAVGTNGKRAMIVDLAKTNPDGGT